VRKAWLGVLVVAVLAAGAGTAVVLYDETDRPSAAAPSPSPTPDVVRTPLLEPAADRAPVPTRAGLLRALSAPLRQPRLGARTAVVVVDVATGATLLSRGADRAVVPASTAKIPTAVAALSVLGPDRRLVTRVTTGADASTVVLVGGGDPTLRGTVGSVAGAASLRDLAVATRRKGVKVRTVVVDDSLFTGPRTGPGWKPSYVTAGSVTPVSALEVDGGRTSDEPSAPRSSDPALQAGRQLAALLGARSVVRGRAPAAATELARVQSPPMATLVELMLVRSDNDLAEALGRHVALASRLPATFEGEAAAVAAAVRPLLGGGGELGLRDTSGLSRLNRLRPDLLTRLVARAVADEAYGPLVTGLPVAGFDGTLSERYRTGPARVAAGAVRAKTGTLDGVSALAGLVRTRSGRLLAFDLTADGVPLGATGGAAAALDRVAAALASCGCR
jgi:D-alanyl-D-alanine carboxypeptidase/D-alanyl-D-alanine-endopeptidase (penicillin-binding protein 4)